MNQPKHLLDALPNGLKVGADGKLILPHGRPVAVENKVAIPAVQPPPSQPSPTLPPCETCQWNMNNRCQHPDQGCAPCKQGMGLTIARTKPNFKCPLKKL
jgi:hypothetical protein